jgi:hypothetical protein
MLGVGKVDKQLLSASFSPGNQDIICHIAGDTRARCKPIIASLLACFFFAPQSISHIQLLLLSISPNSRQQAFQEALH